MPNIGQEGTDWESWVIVAKLKMQRKNMRDLSKAAGLGADTLKNALYRPWPKGERIIADALGVAPEEIWPSRYNNRANKVA